jgi:organic hydroperoxide reductase OsmC/OhrA
MSELTKDTGLESADRALASVDVAKRETLRKLILGAAFVIPVVATFSVDGLVSKAHAVCSPNSVYSGKCAI